MIFSLDVRRARKGDCFLLHFGSPGKPGLVLIDGGPKSVYGPQLRPRLMQIRQSRQLAPDRPLPIDLLMVSHVDDDHIQGILDLTRELREAPGVPFVRIRRLWHNSFDAIIGRDPQELTSSVQAQFGSAALSGDLPEDATLDREDDSGEDEEVVVSTLKVLASIAQGFHLRLDAEALGIPLNPQFDGKLAMAAAGAVGVANGLTFTVAGPMQPALIALQKKHDAWLAELKAKGLTPEQALAAYVDKSVPNLSSIVVLARLGGKAMLLTGDARGDRILEGLTLAGVLTPGKPLHVDLLKVPHHGSANNLEVGFFQRITADHYVFSGDGEHGNPERESMEMLFTAQPTRPFTLHLTYPIDEIDVLREKDWAKERAKEAARNLKRQEAGKPPLPERPAWLAEAQSLAAFFQHHPLAPGQALQVVPPSLPHVIDLLDPLGF
jgi:hypothetical protein